MSQSLKIYFFLSLGILFSYSSISQVSEVEFGKNRIQYHDDFEQWLYYESQNFITYWYGKARNQGIATVKLAEQDHDEILDIVEHRINDKIELIVFTDISDLNQSNIGTEEILTHRPNRTKIEGNKIFVHFEGDYEQLRTLIREGIAEIFLNSMFFGSNLQELVQNSVTLNIPGWYKEGLIKYIGTYWSSESDNQLRDIFLNEKKTDFKKLINFYPELVGHSFWYYLSLTYGRSEISNLLYLTRINRNLEDAFIYVFGVPFENITEKWEEYFRIRYLKEAQILQALDVENKIFFTPKKKVPISFFRYSPDGSKIAIVDNQIGKARVFIRDRGTGQAYRILKTGFKNNAQSTDYNYPKVAWTPDGQTLFVIYEHRDRIWLREIEISTRSFREQILPERYERVYSFACLNNDELIFSALSTGLVDLFSYTPANRQSVQLTHDIFDDRDVRVVSLSNRTGLLFSSNRPDELTDLKDLDTSMHFGKFNVFFQDLSVDPPFLHQLTFDEDFNIRQPHIYAENTLLFLTNESGVYNLKSVRLEQTGNRFLIKFMDGSQMMVQQDSMDKMPKNLISDIQEVHSIVTGSESVFMTNHLYNLRTYDLHPDEELISELFYADKNYHLIEHPFPLISNDDTPTTSHFQISRNRKRVQPPVQSIVPVQEEEVVRMRDDPQSEEIYLFQTEWEDMEIEEDHLADSEIEVISTQNWQRTPIDNQRYNQTRINRLRIVPYRLKFNLNYLTTSMDNSLLFEGLDSYAAFKEEYEPPQVGILIKTNFKDLFEDYEFTGGLRIPTSFNGTEYFLVFDDKKRRLDKRYAFYRKTLSENIPLNNTNQRSRNIILLGQFRVSYPLDIYNSVRATATLRQDKYIFLASDRNSLNNPDMTDKRVGLRLEYVFDNTLDIDINIRDGARAKLYVEAVKKFDLSFDPWDLSFSDGFMTVIGLDARYYYNFFKHSVFAFRASASTSFGSESILYFLGGVDNWLMPAFNDQIPQPPLKNFAYQTISPNLRGFDYNVRNGSSIALLNTEVRIPFIKYLSSRDIKLAFLRHMQLVGFFDIGAAWEGWSPWDEDNPINIIHLENPPTVNVQVNYYRDPLVMGYGIGFRTMLFGYFIRVDYAWGIETKIRQTPKLHLAMGLDF